MSNTNELTHEAKSGNSVVTLRETKLEHSMFMDYLVTLYVRHPKHDTAYAIRRVEFQIYADAKAAFEKATAWMTDKNVNSRMAKLA